MRSLLIAMVSVAAVSFWSPQPATAQQTLGLLTFGSSSDVNDQHFGTLGGGVVFDAENSWVSFGGQGDLFFSNGYVAGRGGPILEVKLTRHPIFRPILIGGYTWGEEAGPTFGAGVDLWSRGRVGFRATIQDYPTSMPAFSCAYVGYSQSECDNFHGGQAYTAHRATMQFGVVWR